MRPDLEWGTYVDRSHAQAIKRERELLSCLLYIILIVWCLDVPNNKPSTMSELCKPYMRAYPHLLIKCIPR